MSASNKHELGINIAFQVVLCVCALLVYIITLNRDVQPADSGEFQIAAYSLGIPHPPGYPLFTMLGWLFAQVPIGTPFARITFLSVIASTAALLLVSLSVQLLSLKLGEAGNAEDPRIPRWASILFGFMAAIALGTSTTFWAQATTTNIRSLTAFFTALMIFAVALLYIQIATNLRRTKWALCLFTGALGLGVGHHVSLVFIGAILCVFTGIVLIRRRIPAKLLIPAGICLAATQVVWLYLPIRDAAGARFAPGTLTSIDGLLFHIFARGFAGDMLAFAAPGYLFDRLAVMPTLFQFEFSIPLLVFILLGAITLLVRRRRIDFALISATALHLFITITYRAPQTVEYAIPAWVILCVLLGTGGVAVYVFVSRAINTITLRLRHELHFVHAHLAGLGIVLLICGVFIIRDAWDRFPSFVALSVDLSTRTSAAGALESVAPGSTILSQWHQATPMWALQDVEGLRRDVEVQYVYPHGIQPYAETFAEQAAATSQQVETYGTSYFVQAFTGKGLFTTPLIHSGLWALSTHSSLSTIVDGSTQLFDNRIEVAGLALLSNDVAVGSSLDVNVTWRIRTETHTGEALTVRIMRQDGRLAGNADIQLDPLLPIDIWQTRQVRLGIPIDLLPGIYTVQVGAYQMASGKFKPLPGVGPANILSGPNIQVIAATQSPPTQHPMAQPFEDGAVLVGVDYDTGIPGKWRLLTHWELPTRPVTISIVNATGAVLNSPQLLPSNTGSTGYFTLIHDIEPATGLRVIGGNPDLLFAIPDGSTTERYIPFADQMVLTDVSDWRDGSQIKVDLSWLAAKPLTVDYIMSARISGDGYSATHDSVPALGTLPTLKWIRGSRIMDRHPFTIGDYHGSLHGSVVVYDSTTQQELPALDERYESGITFEVR